MATPRVAAGALFLDVEDRVLLVKPTYKEKWDIPGGYVEPGESPLQACRREVREELGIEPSLGQLLVVDWAPNDGEGDKILWIFDGGLLDHSQLATIRLDPAELERLEFHRSDELDTALVPRLARRISMAIEARRLHGTLYLEHGREPQSTARDGRAATDARARGR
jgi:ADP-ribose pyrophosphatase YjhB (NUDIX family)